MRAWRWALKSILGPCLNRDLLHCSPTLSSRPLLFPKQHTVPRMGGFQSRPDMSRYYRRQTVSLQVFVRKFYNCNMQRNQPPLLVMTICAFGGGAVCRHWAVGVGQIETWSKTRRGIPDSHLQIRELHAHKLQKFQSETVRV